MSVCAQDAQRKAGGGRGARFKVAPCRADSADRRWGAAAGVMEGQGEKCEHDKAKCALKPLKANDDDEDI